MLVKTLPVSSWMYAATLHLLCDFEFILVSIGPFPSRISHTATDVCLHPFDMQQARERNE